MKAKESKILPCGGTMTNMNTQLKINPLDLKKMETVETFTPTEMRVLQRFFTNVWHRFPSFAMEGSNTITKSDLIDAVINYSNVNNMLKYRGEKP